LLDGRGDEAARYVDEAYERPELVPPAKALFEMVRGGKPVGGEILKALTPVDGIDAMCERARELGVGG